MNQDLLVIACGDPGRQEVRENVHIVMDRGVTIDETQKWQHYGMTRPVDLFSMHLLMHLRPGVAKFAVRNVDGLKATFNFFIHGLFLIEIEK